MQNVKHKFGYGSLEMYFKGRHFGASGVSQCKLIIKYMGIEMSYHWIYGLVGDVEVETVDVLRRVDLVSVTDLSSPPPAVSAST